MGEGKERRGGGESNWAALDLWSCLFFSFLCLYPPHGVSCRMYYLLYLYVSSVMMYICPHFFFWGGWRVQKGRYTCVEGGGHLDVNNNLAQNPCGVTKAAKTKTVHI